MLIGVRDKLAAALAATGRRAPVLLAVRARLVALRHPPIGENPANAALCWGGAHSSGAGEGSTAAREAEGLRRGPFGAVTGCADSAPVEPGNSSPPRAPGAQKRRSPAN